MARTVCSHRVGGRFGRFERLSALGLAAAVAGGCNLIGHSSSPTTSSLPSSTTVPAATTTLPVTTTTLPVSGPQGSGPRTVLSPLGLNVRKAPSKSSPAVGTAAQGVVLTVLRYTSSNGGWLKVQGTTVTGWISAQPALSAPGEFRSYSSGAFRALYPATWRVSRLQAISTSASTTAAAPSTSGAARVPTARVLFRPTSGSGDIVVSAADGVPQLPDGRVGYGFARSSQVVVCGITAQMLVFRHAGGPPPTSAATSTSEPLTYLAQVRFAVNRHRALGLYADLPDLGRTLQIFDEFVAAVTFNSPVCTG